MFTISSLFWPISADIEGVEYWLTPPLAPLKSGTGGVERGATSAEIGARSRKLRRVLRRGIPLIIFDFRQFIFRLEKYTRASAVGR